MGLLGIIGAAIGITSSVMGGIFSATNSKDAFKAEKAGYESQRDTANRNAALVQQSIDAGQELYERNTLMLNRQTYSAMVERDVSTQNAARSGVMSNREVYSELSDAYMQSSMAEGQTNQAVAVSGFRNTGTMARIADVQSRSNERTLSMMEDRAKMSVLNTYLSAGSQRQQQDYQILSFQYQMRQNTLQWQQELSGLSAQLQGYRDQAAYYQGQMDAMGSYEWYDEGLKAFFAGMF